MANTNGRTAYLPVRAAHQNFQAGSPNTTSGKPLDSIESFFKSKMHSAHVNNFMQILAEIWPTSNLNTRWSGVWQDCVTDDTRLFQLLESLSYLGRFNTNKSKINNE